MAHFTTFYSYKGGVGRTLALANVAWLLANHPFEPARVLVVDFDLGAPGLHRVFDMKEGRTALGIVDYVLSFLQKAEVPNVRDYIHKTAYPNIDILPSGKMDRGYQGRLEAINWKNLYRSAHGYRLIEGLKQAISQIQPEYDYVLIDSLTGYSDVGGICVRQLPDSLILLFRLNLQNLDGIKSVYSALRSPSNEGKAIPIIPVITPSWPFLDEAATKWISKAQAVFPDEKLLEISFDSGLSFGEKIISEAADKLSLTAKVLADYRLLAASVREQNGADPLTIWNSLDAQNTPVIGVDETESYFRLLRKRPNTFEYWQYFPRILFETARVRRSDARSKAPSNLLDLLNEECGKGNKFALWIRAIVSGAPIPLDIKTDPLDDLAKALRADANFLQARLHRATLLSVEGRYKDALEDYITCMNMPDISVRQKVRVEVAMASTYLRLLDPKRALEILDRAIRQGPPDTEVYFLRSKALYLLGEYQQALENVEKYLATEPWNDIAQLLVPQILAAMGKIEEGSKRLRSLARTHKPNTGNLAEAYLAVDPNRTLSLLNQNASGIKAPIRTTLELVARLFLGEDVSHINQWMVGSPQQEKSANWDYFEVIAMIRAKERSGLLNKEAISLAYKVIQSTTPGDIPDSLRKARAVR